MSRKFSDEVKRHALPITHEKSEGERGGAPAKERAKTGLYKMRKRDRPGNKPGQQKRQREVGKERDTGYLDDNRTNAKRDRYQGGNVASTTLVT